jgi:HD superfamily phosphodiesterase
VLHDPAIHPRSDLSKEQYMKKEEQTTVNHFHEKLLKLKDLMKTKVHIDCQVSYRTSFHGYSSFLLLA